MVDDNGIENIILLVKESDTVAEFYPSLDGVLTMERLEVEMDSAQKKNKNMMLLTLNLQNKVIDVLYAYYDDLFTVYV